MAKLVVIESPLAGDFERNQRYARLCMLDCLDRGEAPFVSHLLYTQVQDDRKEAEREVGIKAGLAWGALAEVRAVYADLGVSPGMHRGIAAARKLGQRIEYRNLHSLVLGFLDKGALSATPGAAGTTGAV